MTVGDIIFWDQNNKSEEYNVLQFHFHSPSEHTFDGDHYDLEMHIVHQNAEKTEYAVVAIYFDVDEGGDEEN